MNAACIDNCHHRLAGFRKRIDQFRLNTRQRKIVPVPGLSRLGKGGAADENNGIRLPRRFKRLGKTGAIIARNRTAGGL